MTTVTTRVQAPLGPAIAASALFASMVGLSIAIVTGRALQPAILLTLALVVVVTWHRQLLAWRTLLASMIIVILFIPIRRYALPGNLPFQLEPYRLLIAFVAIGWGASLLVDPRIRFAHSAIDGPMVAMFVISAASVVANVNTIQAAHVTSDAIKQLTFLASFLVLFYILVGLVRRLGEADTLLRVLVGAGGVVAASAMVEISTGFNVFNHLDKVIPFLTQTNEVKEVARGGHLRVVASSQHPIALGAMFVLLIPMALYLSGRSARKRWLTVMCLLGLGTLATGSRTAIVMLLTVLGVYLVLRTKETIRLWPAVIPAVIVIHFAMPGVLGGFYKSFFPQGGLVAEQADAGVGSSRVTSLGPGLHQIALHPLLGSGYGAREFHGPDTNSFIVDDQWLSTGMETGIFGIAAWLWLFKRFLRRMFRRARREAGESASLFLGIAASTMGFAVGMLTFDAFSFIQTTLVLFILMGIGCAALSFTAVKGTAAQLRANAPHPISS